MLDKSLKIFGLDNNFSLDELEEKYKKLLMKRQSKDWFHQKMLQI